METFEDITQALTALASLSAVLVAALAFRTYRDLRPSAQFRRRQDDHMNHLASQILQILERQQLFYAARVHGLEVDPYIFPAASREARQLNKLLDGCSELHLTQYCIGQGRDHQWALYGAFRAAIAEQAELDAEHAKIEDYTAEHFVMGMTRLTGLCLKYDGLALAEDLSKRQQEFPEELHELAWTYVQGS